MAKDKLIKCKTCGEEIAKGSKNCPKCGAKNKNGHPILIGIVIILVLVIIIAASSGDDEPVKVGDNNDSSSQSDATVTENNNDAPEQEEKTVFDVGEAVSLKDVVVTLVGVTESTGSQFNKPSDNNMFLLCEFEISNNTNSDLAVSSMLSFEAYCDNYTCPLSLSALIEKGNKNQLDGTIAPGKKFNGVIGYEVSADWQELEIHFSPDVWTGKDIVFVATK